MDNFLDTAQPRKSSLPQVEKGVLMSSITRTRKVQAAVAISAVAVGVGAYGVYATTLGVTENSGFSAGSNSLTAGCDDSVSTDMFPKWAGADNKWVATTVTVSGIAPACSGKTIIVHALDADKTIINTGTNTVAGVTDEITWNTPHVSANDYKSFAVIIQSAATS
ncbi:unannotated protein [freshwater metagenome]|uniref:Unannotated protein n=1 Tax=freshwater metagenome TaxID=449393 RepID=A0A6J7L3G3_9ZZZZ